MTYTVLVRHVRRVQIVLSVEAGRIGQAVNRARAVAMSYAISRRIDPDAVNLRIAGPDRAIRVPLVKPDRRPVFRSVAQFAA